MVGSGDSSRSASLDVDSSACCLHGGDQTCAEQQETGRLGDYLPNLFNLASDLAARKVGVVNVGVGVSAVQCGDKAGFRHRNGSAFLGDERRGVGGSEGQIDGSHEGARCGIVEAGERNGYHFLYSDRTAAMDVACACGSR